MNSPHLKPFSLEHHRQSLRGSFFQSGDADRRRPVVVFLHGFTGNRLENDDMFVRLARSLNAKNIHAVTFDFRGSGESDGPFDQMLPTGELDDALRVLDWVQGRPGVDRSRIGLLGFSLGGLLASCASARFPTLKALALLAPTTTKNLHRFAKQLETSGRASVGSRILHKDFFTDLGTLDPLADVVKTRRATLLIHGTADRAVAPSIGERYIAEISAAKIPLETHWLENANHTFSSPPTRDQLAQLVTDFFARTLK